MTKEWDLNELVGGTVDSIREKFGDLSDAQLLSLHDLENNRQGGARTTLQNAIHGEIEHRRDAAAAIAGAPETMLASELAKTADTEAQAAAEGGVPPAGADAPTALGAADGTAVETLADERAGESTGVEAGANGGVPGAIYTQAEVDAQLHGLNEDWQARWDEAEAGRSAPAPDDGADRPVTFTKEEVDRMLQDRDANHAEELKRAKAGTTTKATKTKVGKPLSIAAGANNVSLAALTGPSEVVFVDSDDVPIDTLPKLSFGSADYRPSGESVTLKRDVEFPTAVPETEVAGAFLLAEGAPVGKARLVLPFSIGGGRQAKLPEGTLAFEPAGAPTPKPATFGAV